MSISRSALLKWGLIGVTLFAVWMRAPSLFSNTLHGDEALFATWASLIAKWRDPLLIGASLDKPPLLFYVQAPFLALLGREPFAVFLPNWILSVIAIPLVAQIGRRLIDPGFGLLIAALWAIAPYAIAYSASGFLDPLAGFLALIGMIHALSDQTAIQKRAGLWVGIGVWAKYQALFFLPLLFWMTWWRTEDRSARFWIGWWRNASLPIVLLLTWDYLRTGRVSIWSSQVESYGGIRVIWSWELVPRLIEWGPFTGVIFGLGWGLVGGVALTWMWGWRGREMRPSDGWIAFCLSYLALHWLLAIPIWDRYIFLLSGPLLITVVWIGWESFSRRWIAVGFVVCLALLMGPTALEARHGRAGIGSSPLGDQGAGQVIRVLYDEPYGTVLYDHWYSWHWRYFLLDKKVFVSWFPGPDALRRDLEGFGRDGSRRFIALPDHVDTSPVRAAIDEAGFRLQLADHAGNIGIYEIIPTQ